MATFNKTEPLCLGLRCFKYVQQSSRKASKQVHIKITPTFLFSSLLKCFLRGINGFFPNRYSSKVLTCALFIKPSRGNSDQSQKSWILTLNSFLVFPKLFPDQCKFLYDFSAFLFVFSCLSNLSFRGYNHYLKKKKLNEKGIGVVV